MVELLNRPPLIHDELREAILDAVLRILPASDRLVSLSVQNIAYAPILLEMTEAFEALDRVLDYLAEDKQRYQ